MPDKEKVIYQTDGIVVTSARLSVSSKTFAITSESSARYAVSRSSVVPAIGVLVLGLLFGAAGLMGKNDPCSALGLILIGGAGWIFGRRKTSHQLVLVTGKARTPALTNSNRRLIESVIGAVNEAIEVRQKAAMPDPQRRSAAAPAIADFDALARPRSGNVFQNRIVSPAGGATASPCVLPYGVPTSAAKGHSSRTACNDR